MTNVSKSHEHLLSDTDILPVEVVNPNGSSPYVLTCEHAGREVPRKLGNLGLEERDLSRHIAWDIGADGLARHLAKSLDAPLIMQRFSRLVIDCNRPFSAADCIPPVSDGTEIRANQKLTNDDRQQRIDALHTPYHAEISAILDRRIVDKKTTALVSVHSFTPCLEAAPAPRPLDVGLLYNRHAPLSHHVHDALENEAGHLNFTFNEPYSISDLEDYTIPVHGEKRGIPNMLFEVRNDHIAHVEGQQEWATLLSRALDTATDRL